MKIHTGITIDANLSRVFEVFRDLDNAVTNISAISKIEVLAGSSQLNMGTQWRETRTMFGQEATEVMRVTAFEQDSSYVVEAESRGAHYRSEYRFTPVGGGSTRVEMIFEGRPLSFGAWVASVIGFLFLGATRKELHKELVELKRVCETV